MKAVKNKVFIIAEAGVNHNGSLATARKLVDAAALAGADAVKFQLFRAASLVAEDAPAAEYQRRNCAVSSQYRMLKALELGEKEHERLFRYAGEKGIVFLSSPFDTAGACFLKYRLGMKLFKIPSGEITNLPYLRAIGGFKAHVILSTGMADIEEIRSAIAVLVKAGTEKKNISLLHCTTEYPAPFEEANLRAMEHLRRVFRVPVGYSDHTEGTDVAVAAAALGAAVIEKHFTLSRDMKGPDHKASLEPDELAAMVRGIRRVELALGRPGKRITPSEAKNRAVARKSIVAARVISKGERFTAANMTVKRPGSGLSPMEWDRVIGRTAKKDFLKDEQIAI